MCKQNQVFIFINHILNNHKEVYLLFSIFIIIKEIKLIAVCVEDDAQMYLISKYYAFVVEMYATDIFRG